MIEFDSFLLELLGLILFTDALPAFFTGLKILMVGNTGQSWWR